MLPRVELSVVKITSLSADSTDILLNLRVKNDLPIRFIADSLVYDFFINDVEIVKGRDIHSIKLSRNDSSWISIPITILSEKLKDILKANKRNNADSVEYRLRTSFYTNIIFKKKLDVDIKKVLPLIYIPEMEAEHIKVDSLNFNRAAVELLVNIKNQTLFAIQAKDIAYRFAIEDNEWIVGVIPGLTDIKADDTTSLEIPLRISFKEAGNTLFELLEKGENVKYKLHLILKIESENKMIKDGEVILESSGTVKSLLKEVKSK